MSARPAHFLVWVLVLACSLDWLLAAMAHNHAFPGHGAGQVCAHEASHHGPHRHEHPRGPADAPSLVADEPSCAACRYLAQRHSTLAAITPELTLERSGISSDRRPSCEVGTLPPAGLIRAPPQLLSIVC